MFKSRKIFKYLIWLFLLVALIGLALVFHNPILRGKDSFYANNDTVGDARPDSYFYAKSLKNASFPFWSPYNNLGKPFLAEGRGNLHPLPLLLYWLFPFYLAFKLHHILPIILGGIFMYILCKELKFNDFASIICALLFSINGYFQSYRGTAPILITFMHAPLLFYGVHRLLARFDKRGWALLILIVASILLGAYYVSIVWLFFAVAVYSILYFFAERKKLKPFIFKFIWIGLAFILGFALAAPQLFPTFELGLNIKAAYDYYQAFAPDRLTNYLNAGRISFFDTSRFFYGHLGLGVYILALFGVLLSPLRKSLPWILITLIVVCISFGGIFYDLLKIVLPVFKFFRIPSRSLQLLNISAIILAGYGLHHLWDGRDRIKRHFISIGAAIFILFLILLMSMPYINSGVSVRIIDFRFAFAAFGLIGFYFLVKNIMVRRFFLVALSVLVVFQLLILRADILFKPGVNVGFKETYTFIKHIKNDADFPNFRIYSLLLKPYRYSNKKAPFSLYGDSNLIYGLLSANHYWDAVRTSENRLFWASKDISFLQKLSLAGVRYFILDNRNELADEYLAPHDYNKMSLLIDEKPLQLYKIGPTLPLAYMIDNPRITAKEVLSGHYIPIAPKNIEVSLNAVNVTLGQSQSGYLIYSQFAYPGWRVRVDGGAKPLRKYLNKFIMVKLSKSDKKIEFYYRPISFYAGALFALFGVFMAIFAARFIPDEIRDNEGMG